MRSSDWSSDVCSSDLTVTAKFGVVLSEAANPDATAYPTFNAFFTRALKSGVRVADPDPRALLMPADGRISQCGPIDGGRIFQAKGQSFTAAELLGDEAAAQPFADGLFATVYLSPKRSEEHTSELQSLMR